MEVILLESPKVNTTFTPLVLRMQHPTLEAKEPFSTNCQASIRCSVTKYVKRPFSVQRQIIIQKEKTHTLYWNYIKAINVWNCKRQFD